MRQERGGEWMTWGRDRGCGLWVDGRSWQGVTYLRICSTRWLHPRGALTTFRALAPRPSREDELSCMKQLLRKALRSVGFDIIRVSEGDESAYSDFTDEDRALIARIRPFTMTSRERIFALRAAVRYVVENQIPGDFVECGVWRGGSMMAIALTLIEMGDTSRDLHLFDTFEGMPPPKAVDQRFDGVPAQDMLDHRPKTTEDAYWAIAPIDDVRRNVLSTGYPESKIHFVKGLVEETIPGSAPARIALMRLDTDWYDSTKHEFEHLYDRVSPEGAIIIDDYGWWSGSKKAADEFIATRKFKPLLQRIDRGGRLVLKPPQG